MPTPQDLTQDATYEAYWESRPFTQLVFTAGGSLCHQDDHIHWFW